MDCADGMHASAQVNTFKRDAACFAVRKAGAHGFGA